VICANQVPDHSTTAEFRRRHETALAELFTSVLSLCQRAGLVMVGVIAIDGTKIAANASLDANRSYGWIAREILQEAEATDRAEDERHGEARGDELPEPLTTREGRRAALREAKRKLEAEQGSPEPASQPAAEPPFCRAGRSARADAAGFARAAASSTSAARRKRSRSPAPARRGFPSRSGASKRSSRQSARRTRPTRPTARAG